MQSYFFYLKGTGNKKSYSSTIRIPDYKDLQESKYAFKTPFNE